MKTAIKKIFFTSLRMSAVLLSVSIFTFILISSSPIDPVTAYLGTERAVSAEQRETVTKNWGLDKTKIERFLIWGRNFLGGDMGESITYRQPVKNVIIQRFQASLALMGTAWLLSGILGFFTGILCGAFPNSIFDRILKSFCLLLSSAPTFWLGLLALIIFSVTLKWFPIGMSVPIGTLSENITVSQRLQHLILPAATLSLVGISNIALHTRQKLMDVMQSDYVMFATARGETKRQIILRHGLRNIAIPALTLQFASLGELFGGSVLAEQVFSYPGLGNAAVMAATNGDMPLLIGISLFTAVFVFLGNMTANILYVLLNPNSGEAPYVQQA